MPPRVNKTLLLVIVGAVAVAVLGLTGWAYWTHRGSARRKSLLEEASAYAVKGQTTQQAFALDRILQDYPHDTETRTKLARLREEQGQSAQAYQQYRIIVGDEPLNVEALLKLAYYEGQMQRWGEMKRNAKAVVDLNPASAKDRAEAQLRMAEACLGNGPDELVEALEHARAAVTEDPGNVDGYLVLARVHQDRRAPEEVRQVLDDAIKVDPKNQELWSFVGLNDLRMGRKAEAEQAFKAALGCAKDGVRARVQLAGFYMMSRNLPKAEEYFRGACENATTAMSKLTSYTAYGDYWAQVDNADMALKQYNEALVAMPKARNVLLKMAQVNIGQASSAAAARDAFTRTGNATAAAEKDAECAKKFEEAHARLEDVKAQGARDLYQVQALYLDGYRLLLEKRYDEAIAELDKALSMQRLGDVKMPTAEIQLAMAEACLKQGNMTAAKDALLKAYAEQPGNLRVSLSLARLLLALREYDQVISILDTPAKPYEGYVTLARAYMGRASSGSAQADADLREARVQLLKAKKVKPDDVDMLLDLARLDARTRSFDEAASYADNAIRLRPAHIEARLTKAAIYELAGKPKQAEEAYKAGAAALPGNLRMLLMYARFLARNNRFDEGDRLLLDGMKSLAEDAPARKEYDDQIPRFYMASGQVDKALAWYRTKAEANPKDADARQAIVLIDLARGQFDDAAAVIAQIKTIEKEDSLRVLRLEGQLLVIQKQFKEALKKLLGAEKADPKDADVQYYIGLCYLRTGDARKAKDYIEGVSRSYPDNPRVRRALAEIYYTLGDLAQAMALAEQLRASGERGLDLDIIINEGETKTGDAAEGEAGWRTFVQKNPDRPEGYIGLADALWRQGKQKEAVDAMVKACELDKRSFRTTWTLANMYMQQADYPNAIAVTKGSLEENKDNLALLGLLAKLYEMAGKMDEAVGTYDRIKTLDPQNPLPALARANRALSQKPPDLPGAEGGYREALRLRPDDPLVRARLVDILLTENKAQDALAVLDLALSEKPDDIGLNVLKGRVRLVQGDVEEGIRLYKRALKLSRDAGIEKQNFMLHYELGQVYARVNRLGEARLEFETARELRADYVEARLALVEIAVRQDRLADARAECLGIIESKPNLLALLTLGDIARSENNLDVALQYYDRAAKEFPGESLPLRKRAEVLMRQAAGKAPGSPERAALAEAAVAELRKVVEIEKHDPNALGLLVDVLTAQGRFDDAIAACRTELDKCPEPAAVWLFMGNAEMARAAWAVAAGHAAEAGPCYVKAREYYDASLNKRGDNPRVYQAKAESYFLERNIAKAIEEARQALRVEPRYENAYVFMESLYREEKRDTDLKELYLTWMKSLPDSVVATNNYAWQLAENQNDADGALRVIDAYRTRMSAARKPFPFGSELDDTEGRAWFRKGDYRRAVELLEKSVGARRDSAKTWEHLRLAYVKLYERAKETNDEGAMNRYQSKIGEAFTRVRELSPQSFEMQKQLGDLRLSEGKLKDAIEAYENALALQKDASVERSLAELLIRDGRTEEASRHVVALVTADPAEPRNILLEGLLLSQTGKSDEAVKLLEGLVKAHPEMHMAHYVLAGEYINRNDLEKGRAELDAALKLEPNFIGARLVKARLLAAQNKYGEAVAETNAVLKADPANFEAAFNKGNFLLAQDKASEAEGVFKDMVARWPDSVMAHERLAETYRRGNRLGEALLEYQDARRRSPRSLLILRGLASVLAAQGKNDQVLREYAAFLEDIPDATDAWMDLAQIHAQASHWADAERALKNAVGTARTNVAVRAALADFYLGRRMFPEARDAARRMIDDVGTPEAKGVGHTTVARSCEMEGKFDEAIAEYQAAIQADPTHVIAVNNLAWLLSTRKSDLDGAIKLAEPYLKQFPGFVELYDTVGWSYRLKDDPKKAEPILAHAVDVQVQRGQANPSILYHYGEVLFLNGKNDKAKEWLTHATKVKFPEYDKAMEILAKIK